MKPSMPIAASSSKTAASTPRSPLDPWHAGDEWVNAATGMKLEVEGTAEDSAGALLSWIATYPPNSPEPPGHFHPRQTERFTLLSGALRVDHAGRTRDLSVGEILEIRPGEPHRMWNPHSSPATTRWETTPALRTEQWMGMLLALAAARKTRRGGVPKFFQLAVLLSAYRNELRLCKPAPWVQTLVLRPAAAAARLMGVRADRVR